MTPQAFRDRIAALGYSLRGFAVIAAANPRTVERWATGEQSIPGWVALVLDLLDQVRELKTSIAMVHQ